MAFVWCCVNSSYQLSELPDTAQCAWELWSSWLCSELINTCVCVCLCVCVQHMDRTFHNVSGHVTYSDSGIYTFPFDRVALSHLKETLPALRRSLAVKCDDVPYCGWPLYLPVIYFTHLEYVMLTVCLSACYVAGLWFCLSWFLLHDPMLARVFATAMCLSVRLSVTRQYCA